MAEGRGGNNTFCWVPGHVGICRNEYVGMLGNKASKAKFIGPELFCDISERLSVQDISKSTRGGGGIFQD